MAPYNFNIPVENRKSDQEDCQSTFTDGDLTPNTSSSLDTLSLESDQSTSSNGREIFSYSPVVLPNIKSFQQMLIQTADTDDLDSVKEIEFQIQDEDLSLQKLSTFLPNLYKMNLSGSIIKSIRALGSDLENLKILNIGKCNLESLDGLMGLPNLEELYAPTNFIEDVGPCAFTSKIQTLNLNNNKVSDIQCVGFLSLCLELRHLHLKDCPVSKNPDYRRIMKYLLPQLISLDGQSFGVPGSNSMSVNDTQSSKDDLRRPLTPKPHLVKTHETTPLSAKSITSTPRQQHPCSFLRKSSSMIRKSQNLNEILNVSKQEIETSLDPHNLTRNVVKLPPLQNTKIISTPFDRPATTSCIPSSTKVNTELEPRPSTSRAFSKKDYIVDLETVKEQLKKVPTLCNPFSGDIFEEIAKFDNKILQTNGAKCTLNPGEEVEELDCQALISTSKQWRARSALYRSQFK